MPDPGPYTKPYLDTSVYIAAIKKEDGRVRPAERILNDARAGKFQIIAATFVAVEVIRAKGEPIALPDSADEIIERFLFHEYITWVELDLTLALEARRLARAHRLKPADAVHLASAMRGGADQLLRWDDRFAPAGSTVEGVYITDPYWTGTPSLFDDPDV